MMRSAEQKISDTNGQHVSRMDIVGASSDTHRTMDDLASQSTQQVDLAENDKDESPQGLPYERRLLTFAPKKVREHASFCIRQRTAQQTNSYSIA